LKTFHILAATVPVWFCPAVFAQTPPLAAAVAAAAALTPTATPASPPLNYHSVFTGYQAFNDQPVAPWRDTNDTVEKKGGWRAYAKEAAQSDVLPDTAPGATSGPSTPPNPHDSHGAKP